MRIIKTFPSQPPKQHKRNRSEEASIWYLIGSDKDYAAWCRTQPSAYSGDTKDIIYAHYRTSKNSGVGVKPVYSGLPLTSTEHFLQHQVGQYQFKPRAWWELQISMHLERWKVGK